MKKQPSLIVSLALVLLSFSIVRCAPPASTPVDTFRTRTPPAVRSAPSVIAYTATPAWPAPESYSGIIAFMSNRNGDVEIYRMQADGSDQTNLTNRFSNDLLQAWSSDGMKLLFEAFDEANTDIHVLDLRDGSNTSLTNTSYDEMYPEWSPDGKKILFQSYGDAKEAEIYVMDSDGRNPTNLTEAPASGETSATWSPDGRRIAFVTNRNASGYDIYVMSPRGSNPTNITTNMDDANHPSWSPDGNKIAFQSFLGNTHGLFVIDANGTDQTELATDTLYEFTPVWSPDGTKIAFVSLADSNSEIYVVDADGSNLTNLTQHPGDDNSPAWSPGGRRIAFTSYRDGNAEIYVMNADGSGQTNITNNAADDHTPVWSPAPEDSTLLECGSGWTRLEIGMYASVSDANEGDPNRVRSGPSRVDEVITQVYAGTPLKVIEGPVCADGLVYWKVEHHSIPGGAGWTAEGDGGEYWLEPYAP